MKNKYILSLFIIGFIITIVGSLFKIAHWEIGPVTGTVLLTVGMLSEVIAGIMFVIKLISNRKDSFLNN